MSVRAQTNNGLGYASTMKTQTSRILLRSFWISIMTVALLAAAIWFGGRAWLSQSVIPYEGQRTIGALQDEVEVLFDARGIARIYSTTSADAMLTLGWLHAGERLFQMELLRRLAAGQLSELVGPAALEIDRHHRAMGFARRVAEDLPELDQETQVLLDAYVAGINAFLAQAERLPPEFVLLRHQPRDWSTEDVLAIAYYQTFYPTTLVQRMSEIWREVATRFGPQAGEWLNELPGWGHPSIPSGRMTEGSNTWVVSPERSASGAALHAADPHLDYDMAPGLWYAAGLHTEDGLNVLGVTVPGLPFVAMGHNGTIAWAFTVAPVDVFEVFRQERHPDDPDLVLGPEGWEAVRRYTEQILVRGIEDARPVEFAYTPRGRVIESDEDSVLVMDWVGFHLPLNDLLENAMAISRAEDFSGFRQAASNMGGLSVNWSYSDRFGNIGYVQSTPIPRREHEQFYRVLDGADQQLQWAGIHPPEDRPFALNPAQGWLANANNHAAGDDWPYAIPGFYKQLRIRRASTLLSAEQVFDQADMSRMQMDQVSERARLWKSWLADAASASGREALAGELRRWDGHMDVHSEMAGLFARWWHFLPRALFDQADHAPDWRDMRVLLDDWLQTRGPLAPLAEIELDQAAATALDDALRAGAWPLGAVQQLSIAHPLASNEVLDRWLGLTRGPLPIGGDAGSLNVTYVSFDEHQASLRARAGASMRFTMDWANPDRFTLNLTLGQSGNPFSPHFDDFLPAFLSGEPWVVPWSRQRVTANASSRLVLIPDA